MRFLASGGALKDLLKEQMSDREMVEGDDQAEVDEDKPPVLFGWRRDRRYYAKIAK